MEVTIALAQTSADPNRAINERKAMELMGRAKELGADVICFPEMFLEVFFPQFRADKTFFEKAEPVPGPLVKRFQEEAARLEIAAILNIYEKATPGKYYNCSPVIAPDGRLVGISRMMHIPELPNYNETFYYWPGDTDYPVFDLCNAHVGVPICWDRHFPEHIRILALKGAEVILIPTAGSVIPAFQFMWEAEIQAAAFANQVFIGIVNRVGEEQQIKFFGGSFVTNPLGEIVDRAAQYEEALLVTKIDLGLVEKARRMLPFFKNRRPSTYGDLGRH